MYFADDFNITAMGRRYFAVKFEPSLWLEISLAGYREAQCKIIFVGLVSSGPRGSHNFSPTPTTGKQLGLPTVEGTGNGSRGIWILPTEARRTEVSCLPASLAKPASVHPANFQSCCIDLYGMTRCPQISPSFNLIDPSSTSAVLKESYSGDWTTGTASCILRFFG